MSRRGSEEAHFANDSFLDVLANMVGILIILIVIAGMRVGPAEPAVAANDVDDAIAPPPAAIQELVDAGAAAEEDAQLPTLEPDLPPKEVVVELNRISRELDDLARDAGQNEAELARRAAEMAAERKRLLAAEQTVQAQHHELQQDKARVARLQEALGDRKHKLTALLAEFEEAQNARPPAVEVQHRLTPISQEVTGEELHFRLAGNRVSVVPFAQLEERVRFQLEKQKEWLARHTRHEGTVGPVDGFSLRYVVERQPLPALVERKLGYSGFRIGVSRVEVIPEADVVCETADEALRRASRFAHALRGASEKATLTFWVYPDSYKLFRQLQEAAHAEGFIVAARPLPEGVPIAGAPNGSRSAGQ
ncbi:MAG: hypothetical protein ACT4QC_22870 [Planctomycetaceae bacterium]